MAMQVEMTALDQLDGFTPQLSPLSRLQLRDRLTELDDQRPTLSVVVEREAVLMAHWNAFPTVFVDSNPTESVLFGLAKRVASDLYAEPASRLLTEMVASVDSWDARDEVLLDTMTAPYAAVGWFDVFASNAALVKHCVISEADVQDRLRRLDRRLGG